MCPLEHIDPTPENLAQLQSIPELVPPIDPVFSYLLEEAIAGRVQVYYAEVPLKLVWPFAPSFDVEAHPVGKMMVDAVFEAGCQGQFEKIWVYPKDDHFVSSDDYAILAAARRGDPDLVPCWVLSNPHLPGVQNIRGPITTMDGRRLIGYV